MRTEPQTLVAQLLSAVNQWRKREDWGRATAAQVIVEAHERINGPEITAIRFEPPTRDTHERMRVNADRIFRWLDDSTKDTNLLPANFIQSILAALPADLKIQVLGELLVPLGVSVSLIANEPEKGGVLHHVQAVMKESGEAQQALVYLLDDSNQDRLRFAHRELSESVAAGNRALCLIEQKIIEEGRA
ncbi:hypothetical protein [Pseudomonas arsenicoxydans]|uniref:Bacterial toxin YdaT domain-containing protein n=1 Tax=Pseudomonas arsenicoxydans TaxID=702115 RepID=A0A502HT95_9PSED|nr:hypothetical protein [Pseudomonas arsenicoxydans]TPG76330.1 hypothetical protein EAH78_18380 [Pseudomonas arsenicoxydans]